MFPKVAAGNVLHTTTNGLDTYSDPCKPPTTRSKQPHGRRSTDSKTADLLGQVVRCVSEAGVAGISYEQLVEQISRAPDSPDFTASLLKSAVDRAVQSKFLFNADGLLSLNGNNQSPKKRPGKSPRITTPGSERYVPLMNIQAIVVLGKK